MNSLTIHADLLKSDFVKEKSLWEPIQIISCRLRVLPKTANGSIRAMDEQG